MDPGARRTKAAALVLLGLGVAFYLLFTVGELADGDIAGLQHLPPAVILAALLWVAWRRPLAAGIALLALAVPFAVAYAVVVVVTHNPPTWVLVVALPPVATALLLLLAGRHPRGPRSA